MGFGSVNLTRGTGRGRGLNKGIDQIRLTCISQIILKETKDVMRLIIQKAREIKNARIEFVSLVGKAANKKQFLITKSADGTADFLLSGRILKADRETHHITGIVYEPMTEDAHGDFMTEEEIRKAAYWFAKNGDKVDRQHNFEHLPGTAVVETWLAKADHEIAGGLVRKGSWLITIETENPDIWEAVQKGEITGFSMGGVGEYGKEEISLDDMNLTPEKEGVIKKLAGWLGLHSEIAKAGKKISGQNYEVLQTIHDNIGNLLTDLSAPQKEELDMNQLELQDLVEAAVTKALSQIQPKTLPEPDTAAIEKMVDAAVEKVFAQVKQSQTPTNESIQTMIDSAIQKALNPPAAPLTAESVEAMVAKALAPILKARGLPSNLSGEKEIEKSGEQHYLAGII